MNRKEPATGQQIIVARLAGQSLEHLCAAGNIRAMPETEPREGTLFAAMVPNFVLWQGNARCRVIIRYAKNAK